MKQQRQFYELFMIICEYEQFKIDMIYTRTSRGIHAIAKLIDPLIGHRFAAAFSLIKCFLCTLPLLHLYAMLYTLYIYDTYIYYKSIMPMLHSIIYQPGKNDFRYKY